MYGLGAYTIQGFLIPRPTPGEASTVSEGPWEDFEATWSGYWKPNQLSQMLISVEADLSDPVSPGAQNNLYISALDVIVTQALPNAIVPWSASEKPEGRIKWMVPREIGETGPNSGKWRDGDTLSWDGTNGVFDRVESILGTAHKGGITQEQADEVVNRYEIYGWLSRDRSWSASLIDNPKTKGYGWLVNSIGPMDTTIAVNNLSDMIDPGGKTFQAFLIRDELIVVEDRYIGRDTGVLSFVHRGYNETQQVPHPRNTPIFPIAYWELLYQVKIAGAVPGDFVGNAVGFDTPPNTDDGTPGELLQRGSLDLRSFSGSHPIQWLLRLRVVDILGRTTETNMDLANRPDQFISTGPGAYFGVEGDESRSLPSKRILYIQQIRPPKRPTIVPTQ